MAPTVIAGIVNRGKRKAMATPVESQRCGFQQQTRRVQNCLWGDWLRVPPENEKGLRSAGLSRP
ncbi:hypothetical protein Psta_0807 [Pirellula staleyi DSM 6068]|uniref:Uncharacterized protein n=1 Tax=Pirellula staleyi (strain ATCC 27377 / DSM 6068 / ICPB 4128) TaxID=530564 RepID=D2R6B4_PIRSD|nr:hypothetical protein Psta_0807 [Pirellula staleyi DSM 6068]